MAFCRQCGRNLADDDAFCPQCGLGRGAAPTGAAPTGTTPTGMVPQFMTGNPMLPEKPKKSKAWLIILLTIVCAAAVGLGIFLLTRDDDEDSSGKERDHSSRNEDGKDEGSKNDPGKEPGDNPDKPDEPAAEPVDYYKYIRDEVLPKRGYANLEALSDTFVANKYQETGDWYKNEGILSAVLCDMNKDGVEDCVLFYVDLIPDSKLNVHAVFAQIYTVQNGEIVPLCEPVNVAGANGVSHVTAYVGVVEIRGQSYIYRQSYGYSFVAAGGQQVSICDYFYGIHNDKLELIMYTTESSYDYQNERERSGGLSVRVSGSEFEKQDFSDEEYHTKTFEYLGFTEYNTMSYSCPTPYHKKANGCPDEHIAETLWGTSALKPAFKCYSRETYFNTSGWKVTVEVTLTDYSELKSHIDAVVD